MRGLHAYQEGNDEYSWIYQSTPYIGHPAYKKMGAGAGYAVATAAMVSGAVGFFPTGFLPMSPLGMGRLVAIEHALDLPLLKDGIP